MAISDLQLVGVVLVDSDASQVVRFVALGDTVHELFADVAARLEQWAGVTVSAEALRAGLNEEVGVVEAGWPVFVQHTIQRDGGITDAVITVNVWPVLAAVSMPPLIVWHHDSRQSRVGCGCNALRPPP